MPDDLTPCTRADATGVPKVHLWFRCPHCGFDWERNMLAESFAEFRGAHCPRCFSTIPAQKVLTAKRDYIGHLMPEDASVRLGTRFQGVC